MADDSSGQAASDALSEEIAQLKAGVAAEKVRFSHMTEALEATKGSLEEVSVQPAFDLILLFVLKDKPSVMCQLVVFAYAGDCGGVANDFVCTCNQNVDRRQHGDSSVHPFARRIYLNLSWCAMAARLLCSVLCMEPQS